MITSRGDISIYLALLVGMMILGSAVLISLILVRQMALTNNLVASERAYYAAKAGVEEGFYRLALARRGAAPGDINPPYAPGRVTYPTRDAIYEEAVIDNHIQLFGGLCGYIRGIFADEQRFIFVGRGACH
jgi:hypothetical protein